MSWLLSDWTPAIQSRNELKEDRVKGVLCATVDLEASQRVRSPSPSRTWHVVLPSLDREGQGALAYHSPRESLVSPSRRTKPSLWEKAFARSTGFMILDPNVLVEKLSSALLVPERKVGLASIFVTTVTEFMWIITWNFPGKCRSVFSNMSSYSPWTSSNCSILFWKRDTRKCTYSCFGQ